MSVSRDRGFAQGFGAGAAGALLAGLGFTALVGPGGEGLMTSGEVWAWVSRNLGYSMPVFAVVLAMFVRSLGQLRRRVEEGRPVDEVAQAEHLADIWTSLFFGVGVIWTAIGMRHALLFALGDPEATVASGAMEVLRRLVDGGILVALSTTIFGGVGGYLMRLAKTLTVGAELKRFYGEAATREAEAVHDTLLSIERHLSKMAGPESGAAQEAES